MKTLVYSTKYKRDFKRYKNNPQKLKHLFEVLRMLQEDIPLPAHHKKHRLKGNFPGYWECHIENDFLLIWIDEENNVVELLRLGTHAELFK